MILNNSHLKNIIGGKLSIYTSSCMHVLSTAKRKMQNVLAVYILIISRSSCLLTFKLAFNFIDPFYELIYVLHFIYPISLTPLGTNFLCFWIH